MDVAISSPAKSKSVSYSYGMLQVDCAAENKREWQKR
jgi:hypothetical protein